MSGTSLLTGTKTTFKAHWLPKLVGLICMSRHPSYLHRACQMRFCCDRTSTQQAHRSCLEVCGRTVCGQKTAPIPLIKMRCSDGSQATAKKPHLCCVGCALRNSSMIAYPGLNVDRQVEPLLHTACKAMLIRGNDRLLTAMVSRCAVPAACLTTWSPMARTSFSRPEVVCLATRAVL